MRERIGKYHVLQRLAQGGMAEVYKVKTVGIAGFEKVQALKRILPAQARSERFIKSFIDEARIAVELSHRNIVQVFDFGQDDGELYLTMELIEGRDLRTVMAQSQERGRPLPLPLACYILAEVASGLEYAHTKTDRQGNPLGIVHCDVSPANVMLSSDGYVKILDFGVARASFASAIERRRLRGKPRYMAPEQTLGDPPTPASDLFALGIIGWELLTGLPLFEGKDVKGILEAVRRAAMPRVDRLNPDVSPELSDAIARALRVAPSTRGETEALGRAAKREAGNTGARALAAWLEHVASTDGTGLVIEPHRRRTTDSTFDTLSSGSADEGTRTVVGDLTTSGDALEEEKTIPGPAPMPPPPPKRRGRSTTRPPRRRRTRETTR